MIEFGIKDQIDKKVKTYVKENHIDCHTCMDRSEVTEALEDMLEDAPTYDGTLLAH